MAGPSCRARVTQRAQRATHHSAQQQHSLYCRLYRCPAQGTQSGYRAALRYSVDADHPRRRRSLKRLCRRAQYQRAHCARYHRGEDCCRGEDCRYRANRRRANCRRVDVYWYERTRCPEQLKRRLGRVLAQGAGWPQRVQVRSWSGRWGQCGSRMSSRGVRGLCCLSALLRCPCRAAPSRVGHLQQRRIVVRDATESLLALPTTRVLTVVL